MIRAVTLLWNGGDAVMEYRHIDISDIGKWRGAVLKREMSV